MEKTRGTGLKSLRLRGGRKCCYLFLLSLKVGTGVKRREGLLFNTSPPRWKERTDFLRKFIYYLFN